MPFTMKLWADGPSGNTPITAAELNRLETGISEAHSVIAEQAAALADAEAAITNLTERVTALEALGVGTP